MRQLRLGVSLAATAVGLTNSPLAAAQGPIEDNARSSELQEIVVTAQRREENARDVPISLSVISSEQLENRGLDNVRDLQYVVANLTTYDTGNFNPNIIIRGVSSGARNLGFESSLGVYIDGVYTGRTASFTQELEDIERVEVLRGPQGTLFGKNTTSGAINITTLRPDDTLRGYGIVEIGNGNYYRVTAGLSGPLKEGLLAAKISGFSTERDGFIRNTAQGGQRHYDGNDSQGARGELRLTPGDGWDIALRGDWSRTVRNTIEGEIEAIVDNPFEIPLDSVVPGPRTISVDADGLSRRSLYGGSFAVDKTFESGHVLTSITAWRGLESDLLDLDIDSSSVDYLTTDYRDGVQQFTQEVRLASPNAGRLRYLVGFYYFDQDADSTRATNLGSATQEILTQGFGLPAALLDIDAITTIGRIKTQAYAGFVNGSFELDARLSLLAGARVTHEIKTLSLSQASPLVFSLPGVLQEFPTSLSLETVSDRISDTDFSPTFGVTYKLSDTANTYLRYSRGYKSGGWNAELLTPNSTNAVTFFDVSAIRFSPESIENYELGLKADLFSRVRINAALFWQEYSNIQISRFVGGLQGYATDNAGSARSRGFELELAARAAPGLDLIANVGYSDARYKRYEDGCGDGCDLDGQRLDAPEWTLALGAQYVFPIAGKLQGLARGDCQDFRVWAGG